MSLLLVLLSLTRANAIYLILFMIPFILFYKKNIFYKNLSNCLLLIIFYIIFISPLLIYNNKLYEKFTIVNPKYQKLAITDNMMYFKMYSDNLSREEAKVENIKIYNFLSNNNLETNKDDDYQKFLANSPEFFLDYIMYHDYHKIMIGAYKSIFNFYFSNGYSIFNEYLNKDFTSNEEYFSKNEFKYKNIINNYLINLSNIFSVFIFFYFFCFLILMKFLLIIGLGRLLYVNKKFFMHSALFIFYFTFISGFIGYSRYRIPIEPLLTCISIFGFIYIYNYLLKKNEL